MIESSSLVHAYIAAKGLVFEGWELGDIRTVSQVDTIKVIVEHFNDSHPSYNEEIEIDLLDLIAWSVNPKKVEAVSYSESTVQYYDDLLSSGWFDQCMKNNSGKYYQQNREVN